MQDRHHLWWRKKDYTTALERKFRNLPCNVVVLDIEIHRLLHRLQDPPKKPTAKEMRRIIQLHQFRECRCRR